MNIDEPPVDFARLASGYGIYGQGPIQEPDHLRPALERAVQHIKATGQAALVDVVTQLR
jgi:acetolactate synthase-1/2/3 large subunit